MKKQLMKLLDADGDNQLTKQELKDVLMSGLEEWLIKSNTYIISRLLTCQQSLQKTSVNLFFWKFNFSGHIYFRMCLSVFPK